MRIQGNRETLNGTSHTRKDKSHGIRKTWHTGDIMLQGWMIMLTSAHKKWTQNAIAEEDKQIMIEIGRKERIKGEILD